MYIMMIYVYLMKGLLLLVNMSINSYSYLCFFFPYCYQLQLPCNTYHAILRTYLIAESLYPFLRPA